MKLLSFAWLRQTLGIGEETVDPPDSVTDVASLLEWLAERGPEWRNLMEQGSVIRVAVNQAHASPETPVAPGDEVALFPPVTGG